MRKRVLVLGSNFGGLTAALAVKHELHGDVDVEVVSPSDRFFFMPSLIWLPFGMRSPEDITFPVAPTLEEHGIDFTHADAIEIDPEGKRVRTGVGSWHDYDYLVIATGYRNNFDVVPGTGPDATRSPSRRWRMPTTPVRLAALSRPAQATSWSAATQGAGCFGAAYEFLFNIAYQLRKAGLKRQVKLTM